MGASLVVQMVKHLAAMWKTWVWSLDQEDPLEKEMATHSSTLAWKIPWTEESGRLQSMGSQRTGHDWEPSLSLYKYLHISDSLGHENSLAWFPFLWMPMPFTVYLELCPGSKLTCHWYSEPTLVIEIILSLTWLHKNTRLLFFWNQKIDCECECESMILS